jgi:16S rRNA (cytosine967-C5)-methyltransferase
MPKAISPARWAAYQVLLRVEKDHSFAADLLHSPVTAALGERDAALAEELTLGALRWQGRLDWLIAEAVGRRAGKLDVEVRLALRLGIYQLLRLDRVPQHAAVSESVEIVKRARKTSAAGLVNAVLRKAAALVASSGKETPAGDQAVPFWLLDRWRRNYGDARAQKLALETLETPHTYLRLNARVDPQETLRLLEAEGVKTQATELPLCRRVEAGKPARTECFRQGRIRIQDIGSQRVAPLLGLEPGHRFLDLCAAPGGKTFQALEGRKSGAVFGAEGLAVACDSSFERLLTMRKLATLPVAMVVLDGSQPLPFRPWRQSGPGGRSSGLPPHSGFDRILVDAPCSGTGTLARNPEIKWKLTPADIEDLAARQRAILSRALEMLGPGGRLVYSTCSLEPEENEQLVDAVLSAEHSKIETRLWLPIEHEGDGFFACVVERR